jgi:hypothetical protein
VKALYPFDCRTWADVELLGCLTSRSPAFDACDHPHANVRRICLRHGSAPSLRHGAKVVSHGRYVIFQMAEVAIARQMFQEILRLIAELRPQPPPELA